MARSTRAVVVAVVLAIVGLVPGAAGAHSGGLDSNGGHYCRDAGYEAGLCSPLNSYHCHEPGCVDHDGETGSGGGGGDGGGSTQPDPDVYRPAPTALAGGHMRARKMLSTLNTAKERGRWTYSRSAFKHWVDANGDGCDSRQAVLISESRVDARRRADCTVTSGRWRSSFDGRTWTNPADVDVDHHVALKEAWMSGARSWTRATRRQFANDLSFKPSLNAMTDNLNASKGDRDPSEWLPPRGRCQYARHWVQVKYRWRLTVDLAERATLDQLLTGKCGSAMVAKPMRGR